MKNSGHQGYHGLQEFNAAPPWIPSVTVLFKF